MGAGCCKGGALELNPDGTPKDPQTPEQMKDDPKELRRSARAADWQQMRMLLRRMPERQINSGASKDEGGEEEVGNTALHFAVSINHLRGVRKLLRYGTRPDAKNAAGQTALHLALETGKVKAAVILIEKSNALAASTPAGKKQPIPLINVQDKRGRTPLMYAVAAGRKLLAARFLKECENTVDFDLNDAEGNSLPLYAAKYGWFDYLEQWVEKLRMPEKLLNVANKEGDTVLGNVLLFAASGMLDKTRTAALVSQLLGKGALVQLPSFAERVPLINLAAAADHKDVYEQFILQGVNPLAVKDALGRTPLHYAAAKGSATVAEDLISRGLKVYALDKQKNTPLHLAAMRGQEALVQMLLAKCDDPVKALLTPNKDGLAAYHLALKAGPEDKAQQNSLNLIEQLGASFTVGVKGKKETTLETPLTLAISGHQDKVVKALLQKGVDVNERTARGELPLARNLASATAATYDHDVAIFDTLINSGADMSLASESAHPLLAMCRNNLSKFAEKAVGVLSAKGPLDWKKRDDKGYTPLALAAFHDNVWLVRHLIDEVKVDPNAEDQRTCATAPEVVGTTGSLCCTKPLFQPGTVAGQTPLMCAAKGASEGAMKLLLNRGADVTAADSQGRTPLQHAMHLDRVNTLSCAALLLQKGAKPEACTDLIGEAWPHRAVRYGMADFLELWASYGGSLEIMATTADDADDLPGAELVEEAKGDFLDYVPERKLALVEDEDEELIDDYNGEDSEETKEEDDKEGGPKPPAGPVAEGIEGMSAEDQLAVMIATGQVETYYSGPTPRMMLRWRRRGAAWWDDFFVSGSQLPDEEDEDDVNYEDRYNLRTEGEEWIDEEDVMDDIWQRIRQEQAAAARAGRLKQTTVEDVNEAARGLAQRIFKKRFPKARVPDVSDIEASDGSFAVGSPSLWLGRPKSAASSGTNSLSNSFSSRTPGSSFNARAGSGAGPIAEGTEDTMELLDAGNDLSDQLDLGSLSNLEKQVASMGECVSAGGLQNLAQSNMDRMGKQVNESAGLLANAAGASAAPSDMLSGGLSRLSRGSMSAAASMKRDATMRAMKLISGVDPAKLYANEPYYQPATRYQGLPRYMKVPTEPHPASHYDAMIKDFESRVANMKVKEDAVLEGADLRERNITWYNKSMSPAEFPLKLGKWKAFLKKAKKAAEAARQRRPRGPNEKAKVRVKKVWFGIPDLPSRPELNQTTPLVYAVRLARASCVETILKYSASANIPDGWGITPTSYAFFLLAKEKHNKVLQQITDLLLARKPMVHATSLGKMFVIPRMEKDVKAMQAAIDAKEADKAAGRGKGTSKAERRALQEKSEILALMQSGYQAKDYPSVMEPVILAALLNDIGRLAWLVRKCGGNINDAWVWLPEIPTYFTGQWEKQLGRCNSRCTTLHVAIMQKKYETVRCALDLGADPNLNGSEYSGNLKKDIAKRAREFAEKQKEMQRMKEAGADSNPYTKVWADKTSTLGAMLMGIKRFISSIEIPGFTRPHPWLSPLHLACRYGLADITFLLIKRGAAPNGGPAAAFAPKSPLEEALAFARSNAQSYGTTSERFNFHEIMRRAYLEADLEDMAKEVESARSKQKAEREAMMEKVWERARKIADNAPKGQDGKPTVTAESLMAKVNTKMASDGSLCDFTPKALEKIPVPPENMTCLAKRAQKMVADAMKMIADPTKIAMKAVALAAKIIVKVLLEMMKRPIAHWDPAIYAAHVLLYHRAPLNMSEKQTGILVRDIVDNGNGLPGADRNNSYYLWLGMQPEEVNDDYWVTQTVNKLAVVKSNVAFGYMTMDTATDPKKYDKAKTKFNSQVQSTVLNMGSNAMMPAYFKQVITEGMKASANGKPVDTRKALDEYFGRYVTSTFDKAQTKYKKYADITDPVKKQEWKDKFNFGKEPEAPSRDKIAAGLLPAWYVKAMSKGSGTAAAVAEAETKLTEDKVKQLLVDGFLGHDPKKKKAKTFDAPPIKKSIWDQLLDESNTKLDFEWPTIDPAELAKKAKKPSDLEDADVCKAVVRCYTTERAAAVAALTKSLNDQSKKYATEATKALKEEIKRVAQAKDNLVAQTRAALEDPNSAMVFDEDEVFKTAIDDVAWEAAAKRLGAAGPALVATMRAAADSGAMPKIDDPLEFAKSLGTDTMKKGPEGVVKALEAKVGGKLDARVMAAVKRAVPAAAGAAAAAALEGGMDDLGDMADKAMDAVGDAVEGLGEAAEGAMDKLGDAMEDPMAALEGGIGALSGTASKVLGKKIKMPKAMSKALDSLPGPLKGVAKGAAKAAAKELKGALKEQMGALMDDPEGALDALGDKFDALGEDIFGALDGDLDEMLDQLMAGMELDMDIDVESLTEALEEARDSLLEVLEILGIDEMF